MTQTRLDKPGFGDYPKPNMANTNESMPRPANDNSAPEKEELTQVFWIETDSNGNESGKAFAITLGADGQADLSQLPTDISETLETFGTFDKPADRRLFPKDGAHFLRALLTNANAYQRIRRAP
jgi:hypothetical protein